MLKRKMGFLEELATTFQDVAHRSTMVTSLTKVTGAISFTEFKQAWQIMVARKPSN